MQGSTHLAGGLLAGALVAQTTGQTGDYMALGMVVASLASLAPDWFQVNIPGANSIARGIVGHRGISHWIITALVVWWVVRGMGVMSISLYALWGWLSHVALDILAGGCKALWPWQGMVVLAHVKTGGQQDKIIGGCLLVLATIIIIGVIW